jgi:hypothetical protein
MVRFNEACYVTGIPFRFRHYIDDGVYYINSPGKFHSFSKRFTCAIENMPDNKRAVNKKDLIQEVLIKNKLKN